MILLLDGHTSMDFWRLVYPASRKLEKPSATPPDGECAERMQDVWRMAPHWLNEKYLQMGAGKLGALTTRGANGRRRSATHATHMWSGGFPPGAFYDLKTGAYVSSPCFAFLQMAQRLDLIELIAYGDELCGLYAFDSADDRGMHKRRHPLITKRQLTEFIEDAGECPGRKKALLALPHIVEQSASPMETFTEMHLCLPYRLGGYLIRQATMNAKVPLTYQAGRVAHQNDCYADISWPPVKFDIEYQGLYDHAGTADYDNDRARINALRIMGFEVIELTRGQATDWRALEEIALHAARIVGNRVRAEDRGPTPARRHLRNTLLAWNAAYGHPSAK